jgi:proteasome lid subunit RPN8/RPN11
MGTESLKINATIIDEMIGHACEGLPLEVCGILGGKEGAASVLYRVANTEASGIHFLMDPREQVDAMEDLDAKGLDLIAFYHSHPANPAWPTSEDVRLAFYPDVFIVIVSLMKPDEPEVRAFRIIDKQVFPREIEVV